jgi:hypothetical protein
MKKLTAEKCREQIAEWERMMSASDIAVMVERHLQAYRIALPILEQQERGEGEWIEWGGGNCPVPHVSKLMVKLRSGNIRDGKPAINWGWRNTGSINDIIAYRIIPEQPTNQNGEQ